MNRFMCIRLIHIITVIALLILNNVSCHIKRANLNRMKRHTNEESLQLPYQHQKQIFKDRFNDDKIIFDRGEIYKNASTSTTQRSFDALEIDEADHKYTSNMNGEYKFCLSLKNGMQRAESAEFEEYDGQKVLVIRGFFRHINKNNKPEITAYLFDHKGYHELEVPQELLQPDYVDFRPSEPCDSSTGEYCIDSKLLALMVG